MPNKSQKRMKSGIVINMQTYVADGQNHYGWFCIMWWFYAINNGIPKTKKTKWIGFFWVKIFFLFFVEKVNKKLQDHHKILDILEHMLNHHNLTSSTIRFTNEQISSQRLKQKNERMKNERMKNERFWSTSVFCWYLAHKNQRFFGAQNAICEWPRC